MTSYNPSPLSPAQGFIGTVLIVAAFAGFSIFYGARINLNLFAVAMFAVLIGLSMNGPSRLAATMAAQPVGSGLAIATLMVLIVGYQSSLSHDSSFVPSWGLALTPMAYLLVRELGPYREKLLFGLFAVGAVFAAVSVWQLITNGAHAGLPLTDTNNYGSLLYLMLLPSIHMLLHRAWWGPPVATSWLAISHVLVFLGLVALFATQSRTSAVIVGVALSVWVGLALWRRLSFKPVAIVLVLSGVALLTVNLALTNVYTFDSTSVNAGLSVRGALNDAALQMFFDYPFTGVGIYVFPLLYRITRDVSDQHTAGGFVHNDYLQTLAEGGPLLVGCLVMFAGLTLLRVVRMIRAPADGDGLVHLGLVMAIGAALAHAFVNFVFYTPVLAFLVGCLAGMVDWGGADASKPVKTRGDLKALALVLLSFGWLCWGFLGLDTLSQGVFNKQAGVPFAGKLNSDPQSMLNYARVAQRLNPNRGMPVLAEAVLLEQQLIGAPASEELREATLDSYRRARRIDPWNPYVNLQMHRFVRNNPAVSSSLVEDEQPINLLLQIIALDPTFVPAIDALMQYTENVGQQELYARVLQQRVMVWLPWLALMDKDAALRYLAYLENWSKVQRDYVLQRELATLSERLAGIDTTDQERWFY